MHATYSFHFLNTVSEQLIATLNDLAITPLDEANLDVLQTFQTENEAKQGVYLLHYEGRPVYLGKAENVRARLNKHFNKLTGRKNIDMSKMGYKALLLDKSMGTAANEKLLISIFTESHTGMWNGEGFGPNDPGKNRDRTVPSSFDGMYPIKEDWLIDFPDNTATLGDLMKEMKSQLPYVLRYKITGHENDPIDLTGVSRNAKDLLRAIVSALGAGWKGVVLSYGMIVYQTNDSYPFGEEIQP